MFDVKTTDEAAESSYSPVAASLSSVRAPFVPDGIRQTDRYGTGRSVNLPAIALVIAIHIVLLAAIIQVRTYAVHRTEARLAVVNLTPPAPPPPAPETPPPPPVVTAPPPIVRTPVPPVNIVPVVDNPVIRPVPVTYAPPAPPTPAPAPAPPSIVKASDLGTRMIAGKPPRYPIESRRKHEQGTVVLSVTLGTDGAVASIAVTRSSGYDRLDDAARNAVRGWRWEPTMLNGQPVRVSGLVEIPFQLQG